ncbi:MAG TPA: hypothetical protein PLH70_07180 [Bacteroidales bacterium]|nr:hypothetical protein [Bacteroidales bacterium]HOH23117.1 hypothetical protein [Bacteroidales bacterium]HPZ04278.1 hypothetical protein [Bacteroidales bacterium]HQB75564.1 hypothetical protein [Bacteroidales bacterium]
MKKVFLFIPIVIAAIIVLLFSSCEKEDVYPVKIICVYSETGIDTGDVVAGATVTIGKENYAPYAQASGVTDKNGIFTHEFPYEALLDVTAEVTVDEGGVVKTYIGATQVKLLPNETVEKMILMIGQ